jgi:hypothetical protein
MYFFKGILTSKTSLLHLHATSCLFCKIQTEFSIITIWDKLFPELVNVLSYR